MVKWFIAEYLKIILKFGLELPKMVKEYIAIDEKNRNILWQDAMKKRNVKMTIQIIPDGEKPTNNYQYVDCRMVSDIKMEDLWRKWQHVITYSCVVVKETVYIPLTMAALRDQEVKVADILS